MVELVFNDFKYILFCFNEVVIIVRLLIESIAFPIQLKGVDINSIPKV